MRQDSDVKHDVESKLKCEPDFDASDIAVAVKNGVEGTRGTTSLDASLS